MTAVVLRGDARALPLPDASVDLIVTSPPFYALRDYRDAGESMAGQIGSEATPGEYITALLDCTRDWMRVLKPSGSLFVELGDKYDSSSHSMQGVSSRHNIGQRGKARRIPVLGQPKCLMDLPHRYAIRCVDDLGLIKRAEIIWHHVNGLPESVTDRVRRAHSVVFHFTLQPRYYAAVDEIREPGTGRGVATWAERKAAGEPMRQGEQRITFPNGMAPNPLGKLPSSVWDIDEGETLVHSVLRAVSAGGITIDEAERLITGGPEWTGSNASAPRSSALMDAGTGPADWTPKATESTAAPATATAAPTASPTNSGSAQSQLASPSTTSAATGDASTQLTWSPSPSVRTSGEDAKQPKPTASTGTSSTLPTPTSEPTGTESAGHVYGSECAPTGDVWSIPSQPLTVPGWLGIDHFAAWPMELPRRIISGWSPPGICTACGEGRRPVRGADPTTAVRIVEKRALTDAERTRFADLFRHWQHARGLTGSEIAALFPSRTGGLTGCVTNWRAGNNVLTPEQAEVIGARFGPLPADLMSLVNSTRSVGYLSGTQARSGRNTATEGRHRSHVRMGDGVSAAITGYACACPAPDAPTRPSVILDPFGGTGTTALVASMLGRSGISIDRSADYSRLARWRTRDPGERARAMGVPKPPPVPAGQASLFDLDGEAS